MRSSLAGVDDQIISDYRPSFSARIAAVPGRVGNTFCRDDSLWNQVPGCPLLGVLGSGRLGLYRLRSLAGGRGVDVRGVWVLRPSSATTKTVGGGSMTVKMGGTQIGDFGGGLDSGKDGRGQLQSGF
ncbi:hypothetical protein TIFTF001_005095 [Ficus carica]|uniref:Uncharacterized protein n=1 Tax=Ficus carica TaxID=3494 RepID=A0AA88A0F8_FICCA|nr:hypothetical protein TIFTF001_005095 [Ficus carica]